MRRRLWALLLCGALLAGCGAGGEGAASSGVPAAPAASPPPAPAASPTGTPGPQPLEPQAPFSLDAYLPAGTDPSALADYAPSFERLGRVTVITGLCWDGEGNIVEIAEGYAPLVAALRALRESCGFTLSATIYPSAALRRQGAAGQSVDTPEKRAALCESVLALCARDGLDGIDLDWETPQDGAEWAACSETVAALKGALGGQGLRLSAAFYPSDAGKLSPQAIGALDTLHLMTYDQFDENGYHATSEMMEAAVAGALAAGYRPGQISVGIPAYGRPLDGGARWPLYNEQALGRGENVKDGAYYNSADLAAGKAAFARREGLQGAFLFHLLGDFPADEPLSLLRAMDGTADGRG